MCTSPYRQVRQMWCIGQAAGKCFKCTTKTTFILIYIHIHICSTYQFSYEENLCYWHSNLGFKAIIWSRLIDKSKNHSANFLDENACRTQDSGWVYSTQNYSWKYYIRSTLHNNTSMLNKYGPDIIKNAEMHVGRPLLGSCLTAYVEATLDVEGYSAATGYL